jgi:DNA-binding transcriptional LysR family regulator
MGRGNWHGFIADRLLSEVMVPVCAPAILERVRNLQNIEQSPLIHVTTVSEDWAAWAVGCGRPAPDRTKGLQFDTIQMAFEAASQGLGVAIGRKPLVNSELESGSLVEVWETVNSNTSYWLIGAESRADDPRIIAFRSWILEEAEANPA